MALHVSPVEPVQDARDQVIELIGAADPRLARRRAPRPDMTLTLQPAMVEGFVELVRLRTELAERDSRIVALTEGLQTWRDRAGSEQAMRRIENAEARDREREIISLLHQQMQVADAATAELERYHALPWWRRVRA